MPTKTSLGAVKHTCNQIPNHHYIKSALIYPLGVPASYTHSQKPSAETKKKKINKPITREPSKQRHCTPRIHINRLAIESEFIALVNCMPYARLPSKNSPLLRVRGHSS